MRPGRSLLIAGGLAALLTAGAAPGLAANPSRVALGPVASALVDPPVRTPALPADADAALARAVAGFASALGVGALPDVPAAIARAHLAVPISGRLAVLLDVMTRCQTEAGPARDLLAGGFADTMLTVSPTWPPASDPRWATVARTADRLRACATDLESLALETGRFLRSHPSPRDSGGEADLWPVLRYSGGSESNTYRNDYALLVDQGGDDVYLNNAGGNLLDVKRGPENSAAPEKAVARGCHKIALEFGSQCIGGTAVLIDAAGNDTYGAKEAPDPTDDAFCTNDPLVRRVVIAGSGLAGVGILVDMTGDDHYVGKTLTQGSGHLAGVGILRDEAGNDTYTAVRNAQGYALLAGFGLLRDGGGNDTYSWYMPAALDPEAAYQHVGAGGVVDDRGLCDKYPRDVQGSALLPGSVAVLLDVAGDDHYIGVTPAIHRTPEFMFHQGSQGYGGEGGVGALIDQGGHDTYENVPGRADNTRITPTPDSAGYFDDSGS